MQRQFRLLENQQTDLHEYLAYENKKILTLMPLKSQVRLRLARVRFFTSHFAWIFGYFLQTIFLANAVIWFCISTRLSLELLHKGKKLHHVLSGLEKFVSLTRWYNFTVKSENWFCFSENGRKSKKHWNTRIYCIT